MCALVQERSCVLPNTAAIASPVPSVRHLPSVGRRSEKVIVSRKEKGVIITFLEAGANKAQVCFHVSRGDSSSSRPIPANGMGLCSVWDSQLETVQLSLL